MVPYDTSVYFHFIDSNDYTLLRVCYNLGFLVQCPVNVLVTDTHIFIYICVFVFILLSLLLVYM